MLTLYIVNDISSLVSNDVYFDYAIDENLINFDSDTKAIMKVIDGATYLDNSRFISRYGNYAVSLKELSTGCKTCINMNTFEEQVFYIGECGSNALSCIFRLKRGIMCTDAYFIVPEFSNTVNVIDKINNKVYNVTNADMLEEILCSIFG